MCAGKKHGGQSIVRIDNEQMAWLQKRRLYTGAPVAELVRRIVKKEMEKEK